MAPARSKVVPGGTQASNDKPEAASPRKRSKDEEKNDPSLVPIVRTGHMIAHASVRMENTIGRSTVNLLSGLAL